MMGLGGVAIQSSTGFHQKLAFYFFVSQDKISPVNDPIIVPPKKLASVNTWLYQGCKLFVYIFTVDNSN